MNQIDFNTEFRKETKLLALEVIRFFQTLPKTDECIIIGKQMLRSATSVGANFRAVCRARSVREKYAKLSIVVEESDETLFWIEIIEEAKVASIPPFLYERALGITKAMASYRRKMKDVR
ncbi:MAG: four helix bundle protein [Saprospiraceae bacterium]|jgi:four helix bundle protein